MFDFSKLHLAGDNNRNVWIRVKLSRTLKEFIKRHYELIKTDYGVPNSTLDGWLKQIRLPVVVWYGLPKSDTIQNPFEYFCLGKSSKLVKLPEEKSPELAFVIGAIIGDGSLPFTDRGTRREYPVVFTNSVRDTIKLYNICFRKLFGIAPRTYALKKKSIYYVSELKSKIIYRFFTKIIGFPEGKKSKIISFPPVVKTFNFSEKYALLKGLLLTDGGISGRKYSYCTSSIALVRDITLLFSELKIGNHVYRQKFKNGTEYFHISISVGDANKILNAEVAQLG